MTLRNGVSLWLILLSLLLALLALETASAEPPAVAPTAEPTKRPYVFPTPIFIPTYAGDVIPPTPTRGPAATPVVAASKVVATTSYTVQSGDNPWTIAQKLCGNGSKWSSIVTVNNIADSTRLRIGTVLKIPPDCSSAAPVAVASPSPVAPPMPTSTSITVSSALPTPIALVRTPTPESPGGGASVWLQVGMVIVNVGSGILLLGSIMSGTSAWLVYRRARFIDEMTHMVRRLRLRDKRPKYG